MLRFTYDMISLLFFFFSLTINFIQFCLWGGRSSSSAGGPDAVMRLQSDAPPEAMDGVHPGRPADTGCSRASPGLFLRRTSFLFVFLAERRRSPHALQRTYARPTACPPRCHRSLLTQECKHTPGMQNIHVTAQSKHVLYILFAKPSRKN